MWNWYRHAQLIKRKNERKVMLHKVKVVQEGYFFIDDEKLSEYEAETVEQALENQLNWYNAGEAGSIDEIVSDWASTTMELTNEKVVHVD